MTPFECAKGLEDLTANFGLGEDAAKAWTALVYKSVAPMKPEHFAAVCADLLTEAGNYKPTNKDFWDTFRRLNTERGWQAGHLKGCQSCGGTKVVGGVWLVRDGWRTLDPFPERAHEVLQDNTKPCACDESEAAQKWRASYYAATSRGWTERTMSDAYAELRAWQEERKRRAAPVPAAVLDEDPPPDA
jgi:hypothetical protein